MIKKNLLQKLNELGFEKRFLTEYVFLISGKVICNISFSLEGKDIKIKGFRKLKNKAWKCIVPKTFSIALNGERALDYIYEALGEHIKT